MSQEQALLELHGAAFGYGGRPVLSGLELTLDSGEFLAIAGPNGGGKTTLFRGLLGLLPCLSGTVSRHTHSIGYVPQRENLDPLFPLQVREVVAMGGLGQSARGSIAGQSLQQRLDRALQAVQLLPQARALFSSLSGGQRQRALIARALLTEPNLLLLDEPTSGVDRLTRDLILELLSRLHREQRLSILLVSHDLMSLRERVAKVLWVEGGHVQARATEQAVRAWSAAGARDLLREHSS